MKLSEVKAYVLGVLRGSFSNKNILDKLDVNSRNKLVYDNTPVNSFDTCYRTETVLWSGVSNSTMVLNDDYDKYQYLIFVASSNNPSTMATKGEYHQNISCEIATDRISIGKNNNIVVITWYNFLVTLNMAEDKRTFTMDASVAGGTSGKYNNSILEIKGVNYTPIPDQVKGIEYYDTEERVIGRWVNGKPLYRKVSSNDNALVPILSAADSRATASKNYSSTNAYNAFDGSNSTYWAAGTSSGWLQWDNTEKAFLFGIDFYAEPSSGSSRSSSIVVQGSNDGSNFSTITTLVYGTDYKLSNDVQFIPIKSNTAYRYFRFSFSGSYWQIVNTMQLYGFNAEGLEILKADNYNGKEVIEYTKEADSEDSFSPDLINKPSSSSKSKYLTTETEIGEWIDGKPIYRKVIKIPQRDVLSTWTVVYSDSSLAGVETLVRTECGLSAYPCSSVCLALISGNDLKLYNGWGITIDTIVIEYTKTTD